MKINKLSDNFTPLHEGIFFDIDTEEESATDLIVEILELSTGEVVATQMLRGVVSARVNIAPYINRFAEYRPTSHLQTTFCEAPTTAYKIRIGEVESEEVIVSINRSKIDAIPALVTSLPQTRRIARGESEEVVILSNRGDLICAEVEADNGELLYFEYYATSEASIFAISPDDLDEEVKVFDVTLYCEGKTIDTLRYTVALPVQNATRLAWISESGAIERYTFPQLSKAIISTKKQSIMTSEGICTAHCRTKQTISLSSRFEASATIESLAQITSSPKVWMEHNDHYDLVEVTTSDISYNLFGEPAHINFNLCLWQKEVAL